MRRARALVFPSVWYEGQPLTVYEALACGAPVIVSDACAGREAVADGETGVWFRSGDPDDLAAHLRRLTDDGLAARAMIEEMRQFDGLAARMGRAAHERYWAAPLTLDAHLDRLEAVYGTVLREAAARARAHGPLGRPLATA